MSVSSELWSKEDAHTLETKLLLGLASIELEHALGGRSVLWVPDRDLARLCELGEQLSSPVGKELMVVRAVVKRESPAVPLDDREVDGVGDVSHLSVRVCPSSSLRRELTSA
jgi:hypothetical protein